MLDVDDDDDDDDNDSDADDDEDKKKPAKRLKKEDKKKDNKNTRQKHSAMWQCYDDDGCCILPSAHDPSKPCRKYPLKGGGTSGQWSHVKTAHPKEHKVLVMTGAKPVENALANAFAASKDKSKPRVSNDSKKELDQLVARWIAVCGRPMSVVEEQPLRLLIARMLDSCKSKLRYELPCDDTVRNHLDVLGEMGKNNARVCLKKLIKSGAKPSIAGDLWSDGGMGLFGVCAHGINNDDWTNSKMLVGSHACAEDHHTAANVETWTTETLAAV